MINAIFIEQDLMYYDQLKSQIDAFCPTVNMIGHARIIENACHLIADKNPDLIFLCLENSIKFRDQLFNQIDDVNFETIIFSPSDKLAVEALKCCAAGFVPMPVETEDLLISIDNARMKIEQKKERVRERKLLDKFLRQFSNEAIIGVPTMEGFEFVKINNIIRCEGLQKCTKVIIKDKASIVSSYNLGEFRKILEQYGFYSPHKSYLINLKLILKFYKEGSIIMTDGSVVPVAKRKKKEFLEQIKHI